MFLKSFIVFWREIKSDFKMNDSFDRITELCIINIRVHTGYCIHTYSREKCTRSIVLIKSEAFSL